MKRVFIAAKNHKHCLLEVTEDLVNRIKTEQLLGKTLHIVKNLPVVYREDAKKVAHQIRGDYQKGALKFSAIYGEDQTWVIQSWKVK